jgi:signal transduction histidine kinase
VSEDAPKIGDFWEIEGYSNVHFAPDVQVVRATCLGPGNLPEPIQPSWDELINGSLTTRYVEIQGIVTSIEADDLTLLVHAGKIKLQLNDLAPDALRGLEGALIRVRGVGSPNRDKNQMMLPRLGLFNVSVSMEEPALLHPFEAPVKRASDLSYFDAHADTLRPIKIAGQVVHERGGEYFLMDGNDGFRCKPKSPVGLSVGDFAEAVGFPDVSGPSPVLREAVVRAIGKADLPAARQLPEDAMLNGKLDATLVRAESRLVSLRADRSEQVLELQTGARNYVARLANTGGAPLRLLPGSRLELTGVYSGQGGDRAAGRDIDSFELLLNSPSDIRVLARPSWWTVRRALTVIGGMLFVILAALVWITLLRRQVEERTRQLALEIKNREQAERLHALQAERARIAQDLHDDLGATLTEIRFLSAVQSRASSVPQAARSQLQEVSEKSRQMVSSLDEIVWAVNPANDSLPSLASYLCHVTEEFFRATDVRCRLDVDEIFPPVALTSEVRHNLYLSVRESMNNIAKHSQASEAWLRIHWTNGMLCIVIEDNGCGFSCANGANAGNGLANMRRRLEKIGGRFECESAPGAGTVGRIFVPIL